MHLHTRTPHHPQIRELGHSVAGTHGYCCLTTIDPRTPGRSAVWNPGTDSGSCVSIILIASRMHRRKPVAFMASCAFTSVAVTEVVGLKSSPSSFIGVRLSVFCPSFLMGAGASGDLHQRYWRRSRCV